MTWSHLLKLIPIEDDLKRDFYTTMCINEHWSVRTLADRINPIKAKKAELLIVIMDGAAFFMELV